MASDSPLPVGVSGLRFRYADEPAVENVSLTVGAGEMVGIVGPNGSGKSTLLRLISGVLTPQTGAIEIFGRPIGRYTQGELARQMAVVPQESSIEFPFSVTEVVLMGRSPHLGGFAFEGRTDLEVAHAMMARTGVEALARRSIHELSGGERQRVIIARALTQQAPILLLDEPGAFLDIRHEVEIYDLLHELQQEGKAIVTVLHDLNLAALYCDRVVLMKGGRIVHSGTPSEVITYPNLTQVYEVEVYVDRNDITGAINVLPLSRKYRRLLGERQK